MMFKACYNGSLGGIKASYTRENLKYILSCNKRNTYTIIPLIYTFLYIPRIFLEQKKNDIPQIFLKHESFSVGKRHILCHSHMMSLQQLVHFHILLNSCLLVLEIIKLIKSDIER